MQYSIMLNKTDIYNLREYLKDLIFLYKKRLEALEYEFNNSKYHEPEVDCEEIEHLKAEIPNLEKLFDKIFNQNNIKRS